MNRPVMSIMPLLSVLTLLLGCGLQGMKANDSDHRAQIDPVTATDNTYINFNSPFTSPYSPRSQPASVSNALVSALLAEGYANIGTLEVKRVIERCVPEKDGITCKPVQHSTDAAAEFLSEAAARGGDLVVLERTQEQGKEPYSRRGKCIAWEETVHYEMQYEEKYNPLTNLRWTQMGSYKPVYGKRCAQYETLKGTAITSTTSGSVWRHEPEQAAAQRLNQEFLTAAALGRVLNVKTLIANGLDLNTRNMNGDLVLGVAAMHGHPGVVAALLDAGADINATDLYGTALHRAAANGQSEVVKLLLARKADANAKMHYGRHKGATPLFDAARSGNTEVVRLLISAGALVNAATEDGVTPLMIAALEGNADAIDALVQAGAFVDATSKPLYYLEALTGWTGGWTPLMMSVVGRKHEAQMALIAHGCIVSQEAIALGIKIGSAFDDATADRIFALAKQLGSAEHSWGYIDSAGKFAIPPRFQDAKPFAEGLAAVREHAEPGKDSWGFINKNGTFVVPPQYFSVSSFSEGLGVVTVLSSKRNPETGIFGASGYVDKTGKVVIPLRFSSCGDFSEGLAGVTVAGSKFGYIDKEGRWVIPPKVKGSPLPFKGGYAQVRVQGTFKSEYKWIDRSGNFVSADLDTVTKAAAQAAASQPKDPAAPSKLRPTSSLIQGYPKRIVGGFANASGATVIPGPFLSTHAFSEGLASVEVFTPESQPLVAQWAALWAEVTLGRDLLWAVRSGDIKAATRLVGKGANVHVGDPQGMTPLMVAAANGHVSIARFLLEAGAEVNAKDRHGYTALMYVPGTGNIEMAKLLLKSGCHLGTRNDLGLTAADIAELVNDKKIGEVLRQSVPR